MKIKTKLLFYFLNCFLLLIPIFIWNMVFYSKLPPAYQADVFWNEIPLFISIPENIFRVIIFILPTILVFSLKNRTQKIGIFLYIIGTLAYFLSWILLIKAPGSQWAASILGFTAPAHTTIIWLIGLGMIGTQSFFKIRNISSIFIISSILFVIFHTIHAYLVFSRI